VPEGLTLTEARDRGCTEICSECPSVEWSTNRQCGLYTNGSDTGDMVLPDLERVTAGNVQIGIGSSITSLELPKLTLAHTFVVQGNAALTSLKAPKLVYAMREVEIRLNILLESLDLSSLKDVGGYLQIGCSSTHPCPLERVDLPALEQVHDHITVNANPNLKTFEAPLLLDVGYIETFVPGAYVDIDTNPQLKCFNTPSLFRIAQYLQVSNNPTLSCLQFSNSIALNGPSDQIEISNSGIPQCSENGNFPSCIQNGASCPDPDACLTAALVSGDPHFVGGDGDLFSFRGGNGTVYALHSSRHLQVNARFVAHTFAMGGTCAACDRKRVHGSLIKSLYGSVLTAGGVTVRVEYSADAPSRAQLTTVSADGVALSTEMEVKQKSPDATQVQVDEAVVRLTRTHSRKASLVISNDDFEIEAASVFLGWAAQNQNQKRLDVAIRPRKEVASLRVAPHGLIGQTFDGDAMAIDGAVDDYSTDIVTTKAMGEGAIEGLPTDYEISRSDPFSPSFKYARYESEHAAPRDTSKLSGVRRVVGKSSAPTAGIVGDDEAAATALGSEKA